MLYLYRIYKEFDDFVELHFDFDELSWMIMMRREGDLLG